MGIKKKKIDPKWEKINSYLKGVVVFPGSKAEFEEFIGYKTGFVDTGFEIKGLMYDPGYTYKEKSRAYELFGNSQSDNPFWHYSEELQEKIVSDKVVALINATPRHLDECKAYFGMPVRKLEEELR